MTSKAKSWRDVLPVHPAAELFPLMSIAELRELGEDIKRRGLLQPIAFFRNKLLDGRNRLDAMQLVGIEFTVWREDKHRFELLSSQLELSGGSRTLNDDADPYAYVISANIQRRHLDADQKRELIAKLLKATPEKSNRQIAEAVKVSHVTVGAVRTELEGRGQIDHVAIRTDTKGRKQAAHKRPTNKTSPPTQSPAVIAAADRAEARAHKPEPSPEKKPRASELIPKFVSDFEARIIDAMKRLDPDECKQLIAALRSEIDAIELTVQHDAAKQQQSVAARARDDNLDVPEFLRRTTVP